MTYEPPASSLSELPPEGAPRRPWVAVAFSAVAPGLGHVYAGRLISGLFVLGFFVFLGPLVAVLTTIGGTVRYDLLWGGVALGTALWIAQLIRAFVLALRTEEYRSKRTNSGLVYAAWLAGSLVLSVSSSLVVRSMVVEVFRIPAGSMIPTLLIGDQVLVLKRMDVARGDVIVFRAPTPEPVDFVKRVVALEGERFEIKEGQLMRNGRPLETTDLGELNYDDRSHDGRWYSVPARRHRIQDGDRVWHVVRDGGGSWSDFGPVEVPAGHIFVLGDNVDNSWDSRGFGSVPLGNVTGRVDSVWYSHGPNGQREGRSGARIR